MIAMLSASIVSTSEAVNGAVEITYFSGFVKLIGYVVNEIIL